MDVVVVVDVGVCEVGLAVVEREKDGGQTVLYTLRWARRMTRLADGHGGTTPLRIELDLLQCRPAAEGRSMLKSQAKGWNVVSGSIPSESVTISTWRVTGKLRGAAIGPLAGTGTRCPRWYERVRGGPRWCAIGSACSSKDAHTSLGSDNAAIARCLAVGIHVPARRVAAAIGRGRGSVRRGPPRIEVPRQTSMAFGGALTCEHRRHSRAVMSS